MGNLQQQTASTIMANTQKKPVIISQIPNPIPVDISEAVVKPQIYQSSEVRQL